MYLKAIGVCSIIGVFNVSAMENDNKTTIKHMDKSPQIKKVKTLEDIETIEKDEFKHARRRSRSLESIDPLDINFDSLLAQSATIAIKEFETNPKKSIKEYRSLSSEQLRQSASKQQLPNLSLLTIKE